MPYNARGMTEGPRTVLDYGAFQRPLSPLFRDYLASAPGVAPFFEPGGWGEAALEASCRRTLSLSRRRDLLAAALERQQRERGAPAAAAQAARLARPDAAAIVTGQQPGLFGGSLFVLYKALTALGLARRLEARLGTPVVPVFWVASDDHDFAEVRSVTLLGEGGELRTLRYQPAREPHGQPASQIVLDASISGLLADLKGSLPGSLHLDDIAGRLEQCYRPGATLSGAFAAFISSMLPDLVVLEPSDPALKSLMAPVLSREIQEGSPTSRLAAEVGARLLKAGYHQQVPVREGLLNLFVVMDGERRALGMTDSQVEVRGIGKTLSRDEALKRLEADPTPWSPGALLRPLAEDFMLPTLAYVAGPAEVAYHAQIGPSYAHFGIPRPIVVPRASLTLVEPAQARTLESEGLQLLDLEGEPEALLNRRTREAHPEVEDAFQKTRDAVDRGMTEVERILGTVDPTLQGAADAAHGRLLHQIETLREKAIRALKKRDHSRAERLRRTRDALFPGGALQERGLGLVSLLARQGVGVVDDVSRHIDPFARGHVVVSL
jgi:bacillithiol biosynthesis cysteine-adding enzyme BshC